MSYSRCITPYVVAVSAAIPGIVLRLTGVHLDPPLQALICGAAIMGASFLLLWACDAAQKDISQAFAIAVVALIAVLPEYAVDMYFTWQAGQFPESEYSHYAVANMTGANRLLIGVAWSLIVFIYWIRNRRAIELESQRRTELLFLAMATVYAFVVVAKGSLAWYDCIVFVGMFVWYIALACKRPCTDFEAHGPACVLADMPKRRRKCATSIVLLFAAGAILANAEPFCEGLIGTGKALHINEFLLIQWLAPIASEMPEFVLAIMFALRGNAGLALGSLVSCKLNQWTLLIGMIPGVFAVSQGSLTPPIPFGHFQMNEILLTAAQSLLAVVMLAAMRLTLGHALLLFGLFMAQFLSPQLVAMMPGDRFLGVDGHSTQQLFTAFYLVAALTLILNHPRQIAHLRQGLRVSADDRPATEPVTA